MSKEYICESYSNFNYGRTFVVSTKSAMRCAESIGRYEDGEVITVKTKKGRALSQVRYSPEIRGYYRCAVE